MSLGIRRTLVLLVGMALIGAAFVGATVSQAANPCILTGPTITPTRPGDPLVLAGTMIHFKSDCTSTREVNRTVTIDDGAEPDPHLLFKAGSRVLQSGNAVSETTIVVPVRGARVCVIEEIKDAAPNTQCVPS